jgi:hypothetical protein
METSGASTFIFFLTLDGGLPSAFYVLDRSLRERNLILVPVRIDQFQRLLASTDQTRITVVASVADSRELRLYTERARGLLKFLLKSKRLTFLLLSSFSRLNDTKEHALTRNYFFLKYPIDAQLLAVRIARYHELNTEKNIRWPGGRRAGLGAVA